MNKALTLAVALSAAVAPVGATRPARASDGTVIPLYPSGSVAGRGAPEVRETWPARR